MPTSPKDTSSQTTEAQAAAEGGASAAKRLWRWARVALALLLLAGVVAYARPADLWAALRGASYVWAAFALPFFAVSVLLDSIRLHLLMRPHGYSRGLGAILRTNLVVNCVSLFLPGTVGGGAVAWYRISRPDNLGAQTFAALTLNTVLKAVALCGLGALALAFDAAAGGEYRGWIAPLAVLAVAPMGALAVMLRTDPAPWVRRMESGALGRWLPVRIRSASCKIIQSFGAYRDRKAAVFGALAVGFASRLALNAWALSCLLAVGGGAGYVRLLWIFCATEAASMLPITPSGWGLSQATYVGLLAAVGVSADQALASHVVMWLVAAPLYLSGAGILLHEAAKRSA